MSQEVRQCMIDTVRWVARVLAVLASGPFVSFLLIRSSQVLPRLSWRAPNQMPLFVAWLAVLVGTVISLRWELTGGLLTAGSALAVGLLGYLGCGASEIFTCLVVSVPYIVSGLMLLGSYWAQEHLISKEPTRPLTA